MRTRRLADAVVVELATGIIAGRHAPGAALPPEQQLGERFDVSRTVVREALARLARCGLVEVRHGLGSVVLERSRWRELDPELLQIRAATGLIGDLIPDLLGIRRMVEIEVAGQAALRRTEADLARLTSLMGALRASADRPDDYNDADVAFHDGLIAASGNRLLRELMDPISQVRRIGSAITMEEDPGVVALSMDGHEEIFAAVAAGDERRARDAMARHLAHFERRLLEALTRSDGHRTDAITGTRDLAVEPANEVVAGPARFGARPGEWPARRDGRA